MNKKLHLLVILSLIFSYQNTFAALCNECRIKEIVGSPFTTNIANPTGIAFSPIIPGRPLILAVANFSNDTVSTFFVDPITCALTPAGAPVFSGGAGPMALAYAPSGNCIAVSNQDANTLSFFAVNPITGQLTHTADETSASGLASPIFLAFSPDGTCLAVANSGGPNVLIYPFDSSTCTVSAPTSASTPTFSPISVAFSPDGNCLTVGGFVMTPEIAGMMQIFSVDKATCTLTPVTGPTNSGGPSETNVAYSINNCLAITNSNLLQSPLTPGNIKIYSSNPSTCQITQVGNDIITGSDGAITLTFSPSGGCLTVVNTFVNTITVYNVAPNCSLTQLGNQIPVGSFPRMAAYSSDGKCLAISNSAFDPIRHEIRTGLGSISMFNTSFAQTEPNILQSALSKAIQAKYCPNCRII